MADFADVNTPWGRSQSGSLLAPGIKIYHTAGHGGMKVVKKQNDLIPSAFRNIDGWYEEDCESNIPFYFHYDYIRNYCMENGLDGWSISAEEYFSKFTKEYFREYLEEWFPAASAYHFGRNIIMRS